MMASQLNSLYPVSVKESYNPNDIVDFLLSFENVSIQPNSIRIKGILETTNSDGTEADIATTDTNLFFNDKVGVGSFFPGFTCSSVNNGVVENWSSEYARYQRARIVSGSSRQSLAASSKSLCELTTGNKKISMCLLANDARGSKPNQIPFSFKPQVAWNKTNQPISHDKTGDIKLSMRLATVGQVFDGAGAAGYTYNIKELQIDYVTIPKKTSGPSQMEVIQMIKNTAESNNTNLSTKVPILARSMSVLFRQQRRLDNPTYDHILLEEPPGVERVEFAMNDSTQRYITYVLQSREEIRYNWQLSQGNDPDGKSMIHTPNEFDVQDITFQPYGIGIDFGECLDLSKNKIGFNLKSNMQSTNPFAVFMYFRGLVTI